MLNEETVTLKGSPGINQDLGKNSDNLRYLKKKLFDRALSSATVDHCPDSDTKNKVEPLLGDDANNIAHQSSLSTTSDSLILQDEVLGPLYHQFKSWSSRPLEKRYPIVFFQHRDVLIHDPSHREGHGSAQLLCVLGVSDAGKQDVLSILCADSIDESLCYQVFQDMRDRGATHIDICIGDLPTGFAKAAQSVFPGSDKKLCLYQLTRRTIAKVVPEDRIKIESMCKRVYQATRAEDASTQLFDTTAKWEAMGYREIREEWMFYHNGILAYFEYQLFLKKFIVGYNIFSALNHRVINPIRSGKEFISKEALLSLVLLGFLVPPRAWKESVRHWPPIFSEIQDFRNTRD
ncbi:MAG: transposase [Proteobacteria bacterium]|nr:transposase [Pseudomonadota bacterium]